MRIRWMAPALAALAGCYFTPNDATVAGDEEGLSGSGAPDGGSTYYGDVGDGRGKFEQDGATIYWQWYDTWEQGTCMKVTIRTDDRSVSWWELDLQLDQEITLWTYDSGAFFWPEGATVSVEPLSSGAIPARSTRDVYYCAEPLHEIKAVEFRAELGDDGGGSDDGHSGVDGDDGGDGDDGADGDDGGSDRVTRGELFPGPFTLRWVQSDSWDEGNCTEVTLINGDEPLADWEVTLQGDRPFRLTDEWGVWMVPSADSMRVLPNGDTSLDRDEVVRFGYCTEPATALTDASAVVAPARERPAD